MFVPLVLTEFLDRAVKVYGNKTAVINNNDDLTYQQLYNRVQQLSYGLHDLAVKKGDRIAYLAPNTLGMLEGFFGVFQVGGIMVPLNTRLTPDDYLYILNHSESEIVFVDEELYHLLLPIRNQFTSVRQIIVQGEEKIALKEGDLWYESWLKQYPSFTFQKVELDEQDVANILYTSGTTGKPKGVMLTHRNNYLHALSTMHHLRVSDRDVVLHVLPMFHVNGWGSPFYYTANGATHITLKHVRPEIIFEKIQNHHVSVLHMAPAVLNSLLQYYERHQPKINHSVRVVIAGSAPPPSFVSKVEQQLGWEFIQVYGMTEASPLITTSQIRVHQQTLPMEKQYRLKAKAGYEMIGCDVRVVNSEGKEISKNGKEIGEIIVKSNGVMLGYWKNEEATNEVIRNGWFHTGDMATVDEDGNIEIVDRKKDIIISGGENISSIEVEGVLYEHPDILEAAIIAIPHEKWGETPHAVIVKREGSTLDGKEVIQFAREKLAHFKAPTSVSFIDELPKTASGKIQKVRLRNEYWKEHERFVN
ncbi:long-chain-fatty-acid--CoA ligase [Heyndrickxia oleronia]|uniref:long-chain-fatty-acid--CoA ligase n=1 Tax=Heyndrickxia oleronia TaxID=38875 RepID=UPI003F835724